jgi:hypothetical protein
MYIQESELCDEGEDGFDELYYIEFLVPGPQGIYKPCLKFTFKTARNKDFGILYGDGVRFVGSNLKHMIEESY